MQDNKDYGSDQESKKSRIGIFSGESTGTAMPFATYKDNFRRLAQNEGASTSVKILFGKFDTYLYSTDTATIDEVWHSKRRFGNRCIYDYDGKTHDDGGGGGGGGGRGRGRGTQRTGGKKIRYTPEGFERCLKYDSSGGCDS